jgi:hypothetical protein
LSIGTIPDTASVAQEATIKVTHYTQLLEKNFFKPVRESIVEKVMRTKTPALRAKFTTSMVMPNVANPGLSTNISNKLRHCPHGIPTHVHRDETRAFATTHPSLAAAS